MAMPTRASGNTKQNKTRFRTAGLSHDRAKFAVRGHNEAVRRSLCFLVILLVLATSACGRYASKNAKKTSEDSDKNVTVGGDVEPVATTTTVGQVRGAADQTETTLLAPNQSTYDSPEGFRLILTVDGSLNYHANDDIKLSVLVWNVSKKDLQFDPNDLRNFAFRTPGQTSPAWTDGNCRGARVPKALETPAQTLHPNEQTTFVDTYPGPTDAANRDQCRVANGSYAVFGFVTWCPAGSTDSQGVCDPSRTKQISSAGVKIRIS
jgi:hypothetical protein